MDAFTINIIVVAWTIVVYWIGWGLGYWTRGKR